MTRLGLGGNRKTRKRKSRRKRKKNTRRKKGSAQTREEQARQVEKKYELIRNNGSYQVVQGPDFWQGDMTHEDWDIKPCCSNCETSGCMSYLSERCGTYKCAPCDKNLKPITGKKRRCDPAVRRGGGKRKSRRNKKTHKKRKTKRKKKTKKKY